MSEVTKTYDPARTYQWNYANAPDPHSTQYFDLGADGFGGDRAWDFCGLPVASPLGIAAGPLLNGRWVLHYAHLGFDVLTYKTVRSSLRKCYEMPNLQPIRQGHVRPMQVVDASSEAESSWAISFGMPSQEPKNWRDDIEWTRERLPPDKVLSVSVVASAETHWSLKEVAEDYATCARWAAASGGDCIELNLSCPNVSSVDGQLYQEPASARLVVQQVREAVPDKPLVIKIGFMDSRDRITALLNAISGLVDAISMTNCLACHVKSADGLMFDGQMRGIGGSAIRAESVRQTRLFSEVVDGMNSSIRLIGVGGISTAEHVNEYLTAGAHAVHIATAAMLNPKLAVELKQSAHAGASYDSDAD